MGPSSLTIEVMQSSVQSLSNAAFGEDGIQQSEEKVSDSGRCFVGRYFRVSKERLSGLGHEALHDAGREGGPHESLCDGRFCGGEGMQVAIGLPLFEKQFDLPSKLVEVKEHVGWEALPVEVGDQDHVLLALFVPDEDH